MPGTRPDAHIYMKAGCGTGTAPHVHVLHCPPPPTFNPCAPHTPAQVEYINLRGTSYENPAVGNYTGNKYYSDPETWLAH